MDCVKCTFKPKNHQQLKESIENCIKEGMIPILQAGAQVRGYSLLEANELKGKQVAFINIENLQVREKEK